MWKGMNEDDRDGMCSMVSRAMKEGAGFFYPFGWNTIGFSGSGLFIRCNL